MFLIFIDHNMRNLIAPLILAAAVGCSPGTKEQIKPAESGSQCKGDEVYRLTSLMHRAFESQFRVRQFAQKKKQIRANEVKDDDDIGDPLFDVDKSLCTTARHDLTVAQAYFQEMIKKPSRQVIRYGVTETEECVDLSRKESIGRQLLDMDSDLQKICAEGENSECHRDSYRSLGETLVSISEDVQSNANLYQEQCAENIGAIEKLRRNVQRFAKCLTPSQQQKIRKNMTDAEYEMSRVGCKSPEHKDKPSSKRNTAKATTPPSL